MQAQRTWRGHQDRQGRFFPSAHKCWGNIKWAEALSVLGWGQSTGPSSAGQAKGSRWLSMLPLGTSPHPRFRQQSKWATCMELWAWQQNQNDFAFPSTSGGGRERVQKRFSSQLQDEVSELLALRRDHYFKGMLANTYCRTCQLGYSPSPPTPRPS